MSLIDQIAENGKNKLKMHEAAGTKQAPPKMIKSTDFMSIVREVYESRSLDKKSKKEFKDYRRRSARTRSHTWSRTSETLSQTVSGF